MPLPPRQDVVVAEMIRDGIALILGEFDRATNETVQTVIWLVGLSGAVLALLISNPQHAGALSPWQMRIVVTLLLITVTFGVVHRITLQLGVRIRRALALRMQGYLGGYMTAFSRVTPATLHRSWDAAEIVRRFQSEFGLDYSWLLECEASIEQCRRAYQAQYELLANQDQEATKRLYDAVSAYLGLGPDLLNQAGGPVALDQHLRQVRRKSRIATVLERVSTCCFAIAAASFVGAVVVGAWALLVQGLTPASA